jgi:hypothetical protein
MAAVALAMFIVPARSGEFRLFSDSTVSSRQG